MVRRVEPERVSGHLHLPDGSERWPNIGTVLAVGPQVENEEIVAGIRVLFHPRPSSALIVDEREPDQRNEWSRVVMLLEDDVLGIVEDL